MRNIHWVLRKITLTDLTALLVGYTALSVIGGAIRPLIESQGDIFSTVERMILGIIPMVLFITMTTLAAGYARQMRFPYGLIQQVSTIIGILIAGFVIGGLYG